MRRREGLERLTWAVLAIGCRVDDDPQAFEIGELCASDASFCDLDGSGVTQCVDGRWSRVACSDVCADEALGCIVGRNTSAPSARCACEPSAEESSEASSQGTGGDAETHCVDADMLLVCEGERCVELACADVCAGIPDRGRSLGCDDDACACTEIGLRCNAAEPSYCDSAYYVIRCVDGVWTQEGCGDACDAPYVYTTCRPQDDGGVACACP